MARATIIVNRKIVAANKKAGFEKDPAISIRTYKSTRYARVVRLREAVLIQDMDKARCNGATVWLEADEKDVEVIE